MYKEVRIYLGNMILLIYFLSNFKCLNKNENKFGARFRD